MARILVVNPIQQMERQTVGPAAEQIQGVVDLGENDGVCAEVERGGGLRELPWRPTQEQRAWPPLKPKRRHKSDRRRPEPRVVVVRCVRWPQWDCGC